MKRSVLASIALAGAGAGAGAAVARRFRAGAEAGAGALRWHVVTVLRAPEEVLVDGTPPQPLADLGDAVEVRVQPAPGDRGTELAVRMRPSAPPPRDGQDPRRVLRTALRESKQLLEAGSVLRVDPRPAGRRKATPTGALLDAVVRRAPGEGAL
ncbi:hypothetical protein CLV92_10325 [Kineococcus xinjiangensis]|uniref:Uncharacterized protein n=1 Tax=Kineococcus xinjiangensis TaxID=512762 RepID=A0A2S6ITM2_9ACTN|nr:hypothetical protein [Kineococcus xinjiangensis]PPK97495.1 hypothetical protein CLV92_10325 [Kineococcus xinjiangensis]